MKRKKSAGFGLLELMIVVAIIAILAMLAAPSFTDTMQRQRVEGAAEALSAALQNAKAEAVKRNLSMRIAFTPTTANTTYSTWCYGMVVVPSAAPTTTCDCTVANSCLAGSVVQSTDYTGITMRFNNDAYRTFNPLRGTSNGGTVTFSAGNNRTLGVTTLGIGRNRVCKPANSTIISYSDSGACPP